MNFHTYHLIDDFSPAYYGVSQAITGLANYLAICSLQTTVVTAGTPKTPSSDGVGLENFPLRTGGRMWRFPQGMKTFLDYLGGSPGAVFHLHGVWMAPQWLAARAATRQGIPAVLSPHNMLAPQLWRNGWLRRLKKLAYWRTMAYPAFRKLPLIHACTAPEKEHLSKLFPGQRIEVIPNALNMAKADNFLSDLEKASTPVISRYILFLGRLHPIKGIDLLIQAFAALPPGNEMKLVIAGPPSVPEYAANLHSFVRSLGIEKKVIFWGPAFGEQKWRLFREAWAFCAPSYTEVGGMVNLEAAAAGTPVITTHSTGLYDWEEGGGILVNPEVQELVRALRQVCSWEDRERAQRGQKLRQLVRERYSWETVGPRWLELYAGLVQGAN